MEQVIPSYLVIPVDKSEDWQGEQAVATRVLELAGVYTGTALTPSLAVYVLDKLCQGSVCRSGGGDDY